MTVIPKETLIGKRVPKLDAPGKVTGEAHYLHDIELPGMLVAKILRSERVRGDRRRAWLMVSALQASVFNRVLERRACDQLLAGDLAVVHATGDLFVVEEPGAELFLSE